LSEFKIPQSKEIPFFRIIKNGEIKPAVDPDGFFSNGIRTASSDVANIGTLNSSFHISADPNQFGHKKT
jgi:hypothetical protein